MKIKSTFTVSLEDKESGVNAEFVFKKLRANKILGDVVSASDSNEEILRKRWRAIKEDLVSVSGLYDEDGEVTADKLRDLDVPLDTLNAIVLGYNLAAFPRPEQDSEKKISSEGSSNEPPV